jgi:DNA-binding NarL/FixJ family response regulator
MTAAAITDLVTKQTGIAASRIHSPSRTLPVTRARRLLIHTLTQAGWSGQEVADHLSISRRAVCKHLSKHRQNQSTSTP